MLTRLKWLLLTSLLNVNANTDLRTKQSEPPRIVVQMDPEEVVETFKSVLSSPYFKDMANQIAAKAVERYISEVSKKEVTSKEEKNPVARQRPKYFAQHATQQHQVQQLQQQKLQPQKLQQQKLQLQKLQQPKVEKTYKKVVVKNNEKNNIPAAPAMILTDSEPQSHMTKLNDEKPKKSILSEQVAYALLKDPSPDGDLGLVLDSLEQPTSTQPAPPQKINGMYFRKRRRRLFVK